MNVDWDQIYGIFYELGKTAYVVASKLFGGLMWFYSLVSGVAGAPAGYLAVGVILIVVPYLVANKMISISQAFLERVQAGLAGKALMLIGVYLTTFILLYVLSEM